MPEMFGVDFASSEPTIYDPVASRDAAEYVYANLDAIHRIIGETLYQDYVHGDLVPSPAKSGTTTYGWNDKPERTKEEVLSILKAIGE